MAWKFDPQSEDIIWVETTDTVNTSGSVDFGSYTTNDLTMDAGNRTNDGSIIDPGLRL